MASIRRGYAAQNKRLGILNPDEGGFLTDREQEEAKRAALLSRQDRGAHGEFDPASNKVRYNTTGQEGRNFLKSVDRFHGGDSWNKNLGGGSSFLQGPSSTGKDRILGMLPDSEALDDFATDKASEQGGGVDWEKLGSKQHDPFKTNYSHSDELATDPEALEEAAMDRASEMQAMSDAYPQSEGDERNQQRAKRKFLSSANRSDDPRTTWDDIKDGVSNAYEKGKGLLDGSTAHKEGAEAAYNWKDKEEITNPTLLAAARQKENELGQWGDMANYSPPSSGTESLAGQMPTGSPHEGAVPMAMSQASQVGTGDHHPEESGITDSLAGLFSSDSSDGKKYKPLSKGKQAAVKMATSLLTAKDDPIQSAPVAGVKMGRVAFPNLLASSQRPVNPRYTNKGLG